MKAIVKDLCKSTVISIGMAMAIFCIVGIVFDVSAGGRFSLEGYQFTKMVLGCVAIGLGFGVPSMVYRVDRIPMTLRVIIHMGIGLVVYTLVAFSVGWLGGATSLAQGLLIAGIQIAVAFLLWLCFMRHYKKEAEKINQKIQSLK